jgi:hypothetical protein
MTATDTRVRASEPAATAAHRPAPAPRARRLWLPWRPRLRLILAYPRCWHYVVVRLGRFDAWVTLRFAGRARPIAVGIFFVPYVIARFIGLVVVFEITIIAFTASVYLVWAEWTALLLLFPLALAARLAHVLPWPVTVRAGDTRWYARMAGWRPSREAADAAVSALVAGARPVESLWSEQHPPARIWL